MREYSVISPADWGLAPAPPGSARAFEGRFGVPLAEVEARCRHTLYEWLPQHWREEQGAFSGHYDPRTRRFEPPQLVNLIAPWLLLCGFDRYGDEQLLARAVRAADWLHGSGLVITHPMSLALGGVCEPGADEAWTKYSAEYVLLNLGIAGRLPGEARFAERALQSGRFLVQALRHGCAPRYVVRGRLREAWEAGGWQAFGRAVEALLCLYRHTGEAEWRRHALAFGEHALTLQMRNGCYPLIGGEYYNSDLAADPIRGLLFLFEQTRERRFLDSAARFAEWHLRMQSADGSWPLAVDRDGNILCPTVGPGDVPNIAIALLRLHRHTGEERHLEAALRALRYSLSVQVTPDGDYPYREDPAVLWGFWSWMPFYDYTVSADQATHHVRGLFFLMDYLAALAGGG